MNKKNFLELFFLLKQRPIFPLLTNRYFYSLGRLVFYIEHYKTLFL